jgi:hypothetical protein
VQWCLIAVAVVCLAQAPPGHVRSGLVVAIGFSAALLLPVLDMVAVVIVNGITLLFPAWMQFARGGPRGIEVMGQQMLLALGQFAALLLTLLPAAGAFGAVFFVLRLLVPGALLVVPVAAVAAALVLAVEAGLGVWLLGWLFERFDVSAEPVA